MTPSLNREDQPSTSGLGPLTEEVSGVIEIPLALHISDSDFDPEEEMKLDPGAMTEEFTADWIASLPRDDLYALSILLFHLLQQDFQLLIYPASKIIAKYLKKTYKTVQKWRVDFIDSGGEIPEFFEANECYFN